ncbi:MAG: hypothetical protein RL115_723 [Bacteroidota bacterium]|jgi:hypothetical protein
MKPRVSKIVNFFAFNLLFFALYLNFIHKEPNSAFMGNSADRNAAAAFSADIQGNKQLAEKKQTDIAIIQEN